MTRAGRRAMVVLGLAFPVALFAAACLGSVPLSPAFVLRSAAAHLHLAAPLDPSPSEVILWSLRIPRVLLAALVGGALAVVGATLQSVFRNPMADSGLLGVGSGAALAAVAAVRMGWATDGHLTLTLFAFGGALAAVLAVYAVARVMAGGSVQGLLLTGLAVSAVASAGTSVLLVATEEFRVKVVLFWLAGGLEGRGFEHLQLASALILPGTLGLLALSRPLDLLALGSEEAAGLGLRVAPTRLALLALAALVAGAATAVAGFVPFVGLMAPHALRRRVGPRAIHLLPAAFLGGAALVVVADVLTRIATRVDLPLGSVTAFVGAPYFLLALRDEGRR